MELWIASQIREALSIDASCPAMRRSGANVALLYLDLCNKTRRFMCFYEGFKWPPRCLHSIWIRGSKLTCVGELELCCKVAVRSDPSATAVDRWTFVSRGISPSFSYVKAVKGSPCERFLVRALKPFGKLRDLLCTCWMVGD